MLNEELLISAVTIVIWLENLLDSYLCSVRIVLFLIDLLRCAMLVMGKIY